jgi:hypothetical protein
MRERLVELNLKNGTESKGGLCLKLLPDYFNGLPDRLLLLPGARVYFVETKAPNEKPGKLQKWVHDKLRGLGFEVYVLDTIEKVISFTNDL